jgi:hypothetical protein
MHFKIKNVIVMQMFQTTDGVSEDCKVKLHGCEDLNSHNWGEFDFLLNITSLLSSGTHLACSTYGLCTEDNFSKIKYLWIHITRLEVW